VKPYPHEERIKTRALIKRLDNFANNVEAMARGKIPFNQELVGGLTALTDTSDLEGQHRALTAMTEARRKQHMDHLADLGRDDLTAFAEVISPHEPPAPHLIYIAERLMEIESGDRDRLILSMPPGHAKDLDVETPVMMGDGTWKRLGDVEVGDKVITHLGRPREVLAVHEQGVRPVLKIVTESCREVRAHPDHLFLTPFDWTPAKDLERGTRLAIPKEYEITGQTLYSRDEFTFAGYMMARAVVAGRSYNRFVRVINKFRCDDPAILADVKNVAERLGFRPKQVKESNSYDKMAVMVHFDDRCSDWLVEMSLWGEEKDSVRVPDWVFKGTDDRIAAFLGAIFSCDATFYPTTNEKNGRQNMLTCLIRHNHGLALDLVRLFQRLGIKAKLHGGLRYINYKPVQAYRVNILDGEDQARFARRIPIIGTTRRFWELPINVTGFSNPEFHSDKIVSIAADGETETRCLTVEEDHSFIANGLVVHNSTYASRYYPAWYLGRKENRLYLQGGHSGPFAEKEFGRKTKDIISSDAYRRMFPEIMLRFDAKAAGDWMLNNGNRYVAKGIGEGISGFRSTNNGIDDPYSDFASAQSPVKRKKVWEWFVNDFMTRLLPQGNAFVISTRWHMDDVIGRLQEMMASGEIDIPWDFINLPVFCTDPENDQMGRALDEPLWGSFYTREALLRQKALMSPSQWAALYDGNPVPADGNVIKSKWLTLRYKVPPLLRANSIAGSLAIQELAGEDPLELKEGRDPSDSQEGGVPGDLKNEKESPGRIIEHALPYVRTVLSVDSAEKDTDRADYSAITVWRETIDRRHYLVDAHRERMEFPRLVACIDHMAQMWQAEVVLMEEKGAGNQYIQHIESEDDPTRGFVVVPINPGRDGKIFRMDAVTPFFMGNRVILPERAPWLSDFERELLQFPGSKNDDYADSTSQYLKWVKEKGAARRGTKKLR